MRQTDGPITDVIYRTEFIFLAMAVVEKKFIFKEMSKHLSINLESIHLLIEINKVRLLLPIC